MKKEKRNRLTGLVARWLMLLVLGLGAIPDASAATCYTTVSKTMCQCINCTYWLFCGGTLSLPPSLRIESCTGTNMGFIAADLLSVTNGHYDYRATYGPCGYASSIGKCCGGARTSIVDWSFYATYALVGPGCGGGGTGP